MTPASILASLTARGFALELSTDGRLLVTPGSKLTPEDALAIREHKGALVRELTNTPKQLRCGCWEFADGCLVLALVKHKRGDLVRCQAHGWDAGTGPAPTSEAGWMERVANHNAALSVEPAQERPRPARRSRVKGLFDQ